MKKWIVKFVKTQFYSNENIELHCLHYEFKYWKFNSIDFRFNWKLKIRIQLKFLNSTIEFKKHRLEFELNSNSTIGSRFNWIENKWDANWWLRRFWKSTSEYVEFFFKYLFLLNLSHRRKMG